MPNKENLKPLNTLCKDDAKKIQSAGGKARAEKYARRRTIQEILEAIAMLKDAETGETNDYAICLAQFEKAKKGDTLAFKEIRDSLGEKPKDTLDLNSSTLEIKVIKKDD